MQVLLLAFLAAAPSGFAPKNRPFDALHYRLEVRLQPEGRFDNTLALTLKPKRPLSTVELDAYALDIKSARVNGAPATFRLEEDAARQVGRLTVTPERPLAAGADATLEVVYSGQAGTVHEGPFTVTDNDRPDAKPYFFTHFEPNYAQRFFPCNDDPADKATSELVVVTEADRVALSNGAKQVDETFQENGQTLRRVHWKQEKPHSTYLVALAVGPFERVPVGGDGVPAALYVGPGKKDRAFLAADFTRTALEVQSRFLGVPYPWAKYDQVAVPRFFWGGMENTSLVHMRENGLVLDTPNHIAGHSRVVGLIAHELAHQWFGDAVTCKTWSDLWLNEGFATYLGELAEEAYFENDFIPVGRAASTFVDYFRHENGPRAHPLVGNGAPTPEGIFDPISYQKGAHVLRMLEHWVGREKFRQGLKAYLEKHALGSATSDDFFNAFGAATGTTAELRAFRQSWLTQRGHPVVTPTATWKAGKLTVTVRQRPNHAGQKGTFAFKLPVVVHRQSAPAYTQALTVQVDRPVVTMTVAAPAAPEWVNWNQGGVALAELAPGSVGEREWLLAARHDPDPVWRLLAGYALMGDLVVPGSKEALFPEGPLAALMTQLSKDPSPYVRAELLDRMGQSTWARLPKELAPTVLALARRPDGLPEDAFGQVRVRRAAMALLGKFDDAEARAYLLKEVARKDVDLNYLPALAVGTARLGDRAALGTLSAAVNAQRGRGYPYYRAVAPALGAAQSADVVPAIRELMERADGNTELVNGVLSLLWDNALVKQSAEGAALVRDFVLENQRFGEDMKSRVLGLLDEVKTPHAQAALVAVAERSSSERLKASARQVLDRNFAKAARAPKAGTN